MHPAILSPGTAGAIRGWYIDKIVCPDTIPSTMTVYALGFEERGRPSRLGDYDMPLRYRSGTFMAPKTARVKFTHVQPAGSDRSYQYRFLIGEGKFVYSDDTTEKSMYMSYPTEPESPKIYRIRSGDAENLIRILKENEGSTLRFNGKEYDLEPFHATMLS